MHIRLCCITDANTVTEIRITIANTDNNSQNIIDEGQSFGFYISDRNSNYDCQHT